MSKDTKNTLIPIIGIITALTLYTTVILLFIVEGEEIGSVAEWVAAFVGLIVGLVAAGFAALAWTESKRATHATEQATLWAKIATEAQQHANALTEAELVPHLIVALENAVTGAGQEVEVPLISIKLDANSLAPIWIRSFSNDLAVLYEAEDTSDWYATNHDTYTPFDDMLPSMLLPGHKIAESDPYHHMYEDRLLSNESIILYNLAYSFTEHGPLHSIEHMTVNLDAKSRTVWML